MAILLNIPKPDNIESHNSLKLSFTNSGALHSSFPWIKLPWPSCSVWGKPGWLNWFWQFLCDGLSSFNLKGFSYSFGWYCSLCEGMTSFWTRLISRKLCGFKFMFLIRCTSLSVLLLFPLWITFFVFMHGFWYCII